MYGYKKSVNLKFSDAISRVTEELKKEGFGVLTEIDVRATLKKKLDIDYNDYIILGACNPPFAHRALETEKDIGLLLPCNIIIYEDNGKIVVASILSTIAMNMVDKPQLKEIAEEIEKNSKAL